MTATLRSNIYVHFLAPDYLDINDYFKKVDAQYWKLKHYINYRLETESIIPAWTTVYEDWVDSLDMIAKTNHKKVPSSISSFCNELTNFNTFEGETILERCKEWYHNFYERYCDLQLAEKVQRIEEKIYTSQKAIYSSQKLSELLQGTTDIKKRRSQDDDDDNKAGPSNEKRSRHEYLSCEREYYQREQDEPRILECSIEAEEPPIEWEFSTPKPDWLDKMTREHQSLISTMFSNNDPKIRHELSSK
ncbi:17314_t:CDS:2 [Acaulospora morrowiae]|uniref:17314_t:CDS:1 n=1 Tax=Acaulospora morrowiae TaxID=94023 RepID=A0A9N8Z0B3_9GLOM|nr:17314_t:CDS:2 [Acaulospora morrowiae]